MDNLFTTDMIYAEVLLLSALIALGFNQARDLMMLQQNSYRNERYVRWFNNSHESTNLLRICALIAAFVVLVHNVPQRIGEIVGTAIMLFTAINLGRRKYKKPLVWTRRATRIYIVQWVLSAIIIALPWIFTGSPLLSAFVALIINAASPIVLLVANWLLKPVENAINRRYYNEAASMLASMPDLKIIGITGSYGKTSTKHYLYRILSEKYDVLMTPGSFNTPMGVIRTVREMLKPYNQVFIVEMGAKQPGDIKEICDLVHPQAGIVTAVGEQHLESFKTIENIQRTKFELVDALPSDGFAVVNDDFPYVASRKVDNVECIRYAIRATDAAQFRATDISVSPSGTTFTIVGPDTNLTLHTRLVGECNISNLMAAVIMALHYGVDENHIRYAVEKIEQVEHRLNMKRTAGGVTIIDDAFNSNPTGSQMALEVLGAMTGGRRIVVTPGMIELGDRQEELNRELGRHAAANADIAIVVGRYNRDAILGGLSDGKMPAQAIYVADSFAHAQEILAAKVGLKAGDTVLYENDLPDTFK